MTREEEPMEVEHPKVREARLAAEKARRETDEARDELFRVIRVQGTILIFGTTIVAIRLSNL